MIRNIKMYEEEENIYMRTQGFYVFEIEYVLNDHSENCLIRIQKSYRTSFETILGVAKDKFAYFIMEKIQKQIQEKMNENEDILKIRMMDKLTE